MLPPAVNYLSLVCNVNANWAGREESRVIFSMFSLISNSQQNAEPDLEHLEQLKLFLLLTKEAIHWRRFL